MSIPKKQFFSALNGHLAIQSGAGFPPDLYRFDYHSPFDGREDWALLKMPAPGVNTWLVCIHGHGSRGDQLYMRADIKKYWLPQYLQRGWGILTPTLRGNAWMAPGAVADLDALLQFLRDNFQAERFLFESGSMGGTSNLIYACLRPANVAGLSARGAATDLSAYHLFCRSQPQSAILQEIADSLESHYGGTPASCPEIYRAHSPLYQAARLQSLPIFLSHGTADQLMPVAQTRQLAAALANNANFTYIEIPGGNHDSPLALGYSPAGETASNDDTFYSLRWIDRPTHP